MDCNNYSYMNMAGDAETLNCYPDGNIVYLEVCCDFFNEKYYYVHEILGDYAETFPLNLAGYKAAIHAYNMLVPESEQIQ